MSKLRDDAIINMAGPIGEEIAFGTEFSERAAPI